MATGVGYKSKAGFRIVGRSVAANPYPTVLGTPVPGAIGGLDQIPFTKESLSPSAEFQVDPTLDGLAGYSASNNISRLPGGQIELSGRYLGLNQLLLAAMGFEKVRVTAALESPTFSSYAGSGISRAAVTGTVTSATASTLVDTGANFASDVVGQFVRLEKLGANADIYHQVRRVTARNSATSISIAQDWTDTPVATTPYTVAGTFAHVYEFSKNLHRELASDVVTGPWDTLAYFTRYGVLCIAKDVSVHEWQGVYVESLSFKLDKDGLLVTTELLPFWIDYRTSGRNSSASGWGFHPQSYAILSRIRFADCTFGICAQGTSGTLVNLGINSLEFTIKNNLQGDLQTLSSGLYREEPARNGKREVTGSFTIPRYTSDARIANFLAGDLMMGKLSCVGPAMNAVTDYATLSVFLRGFKYEKPEAVVSGPGIIEERHAFRCLVPPSGSTDGTFPQPTTGADNGELIIQTFDNYPFNPLMGQHEDYD